MSKSDVGGGQSEFARATAEMGQGDVIGEVSLVQQWHHQYVLGQQLQHQGAPGTSGVQVQAAPNAFVRSANIRCKTFLEVESLTSERFCRSVVSIDSTLHGVASRMFYVKKCHDYLVLIIVLQALQRARRHGAAGTEAIREVDRACAA
jgi:hypothetical protein